MTDVGIDIARGQNPVQHILIAGSVSGGKTTASALLALQAREAADVVFVDSQNVLSKIPAIRDSFEFVSIRDCRLNHFDEIKGLYPHEQFQNVLNGLADVYDMKLALNESHLAVKELHAANELHPYRLLDHLRRKSFKGFSNRARFRDTFCLNYGFLLDGVFPLFFCRRGQNLREILTRGAVVLLLDSFLERHRRYLIRYISDYVTLLARSGAPLERPLLIIIDEAQNLFASSEVADFLLTARHSNVHFILLMQHPHLAPPQAFGACDCFLIFSLVHELDKQTISQALGLTGEQKAYLSTIPKRRAICFLPKGQVRHPFEIELDWLDVDEHPQQMETASFVRELSWEPIESTGDVEQHKATPVDPLAGVSEERNHSGGGSTANIGHPDVELSHRALSLLMDIVNKEFITTSLMDRFRRLGIRSSSTQRNLVKKLEALGLVTCFRLNVSTSGSPRKYCWPTAKALQEFDVKWSEIKGRPETQTATYLIKERLEALGKKVFLEMRIGSEEVGYHYVDILVRDEEGTHVDTVEIVCTTSRYEAMYAIACLEDETMKGENHKHFIVCLTKGIATKVQNEIDGISELSVNPRVEVLTLANALNEQWTE